MPVIGQGSHWPVVPWGMGIPAIPGMGGEEMVGSRCEITIMVGLLCKMFSCIFIIAYEGGETSLVSETIFSGEKGDFP